MKLIFLKHFFIVILVFQSGFTFSQNIIVKYISYKNPLSSSEILEKYKNLPDNVKEKILEKALLKYKDQFTLYHSKAKSMYLFEGRKFDSEVDEEFMRGPFILDHYRDFINKKIILIADFVPDNYQVEIGFNEIKTELKQDTMTINGYKCKKAIVTFLGDSKAVVWYAPNIPISDGPSWFLGLPGLVIKVSINNELITEAINIDFVSDPIKINIPERENIVSYNKYRKGLAMKWISAYDR